jgi:hypothetical protein
MAVMKTINTIATAMIHNGTEYLSTPHPFFLLEKYNPPPAH